MSDLPDDPDERERALRDALHGIFGERTDEVLGQMRSQGLDPAALMGGVAPDPATMQHLMDQLQRLFTSGEGPVNTQVAHDLARQVAVAEGDPSLTGAQGRSAQEALSVAELWLDAATDLPPSGGPARAWSRSEWVEATLPAWQQLVAPVAASAADALATVLGDQVGDGDMSGLDLPGMPVFPGGSLGDLDPATMMRSLGSAVYGMQVGQAAGTLSREVFGATDVGVPLLSEPATVLVPTNVRAFADGLDSPFDEVQLYMAVREAAHARLFVHVPWLRAHLHALVEQYARGITIDLDALEAQVRDIDMADPESLRGALSGDVFGLHNTAEQQATLLRLETALALVEGWVSEVAATASLPHLPHSVPLREMIRRRRAAGGPAEQTFKSLVGLELRPRRSRDAAALFAHLLATGGPEARDAVWDHPDLLPGTEDLDDPPGYAARRAAQADEQADVDAALAQIFSESTESEEPGDASPGEEPGTDEGAPGDGR
ncbi:putative hydrolase [Isoptericola sp. CG 20/1183]|uniref:Hydrolase n=1 Tax=Isoptericola halotolerans TaxID=300560 RepID=A0ABX5EGJ0_9MICO|nr:MULTISPECIES: zinc-dependent metalloprotease [Isoptericola]PRZ06866.1 putative hydrolase [Isoptericola halotolerans]PRZ07462.1 putative hydrolase [Isoptericola sp. CG 20/1183]